MHQELKSDFPETNYELIDELAEGKNARFSEFVLAYQMPMQACLRRHRISEADCEEMVADYVAKIIENRTVFRVPKPGAPFHRRLSASLLHHLRDNLRRKKREREHLDAIGKEEANKEKFYSDDPWEFSWAYSILSLAIENFRADKLISHRQEVDPNYDPAKDLKPETGRKNEESFFGYSCTGGPFEGRSEPLVDWQIFVLRYIGCPENDLAPVTYTLDQIAQRLQVAAGNMKDRCSRIRREFQESLQSALQETVGIADVKEYVRDLRYSLMLGNSQCIDLGSLLPEFLKEPPIESRMEFSMISLSQMEAAKLEELILSPDEKLTDLDLQELWSRMMSSRIYSGEWIAGADSGVDLERNIYDCLFGEQIHEEDLHRLKAIAKRRGEESCFVLKQLHHALYALTIVVAKYRLNKIITSFSREQAIDSIQRAMKYDDWLDGRSTQELELGLRAIVEGQW